jgi:hypothetical protein
LLILILLPFGGFSAHFDLAGLNQISLNVPNPVLDRFLVYELVISGGIPISGGFFADDLLIPGGIQFLGRISRLSAGNFRRNLFPPVDSTRNNYSSGV